MNGHATALIADDEPLLRDALRRQLRIVWPELEIVAEARNGLEAVKLFDERHPDICFLDVQIYKAIGSLLVKAEKPKVAAELEERKSLLDTRSTVMARQEERIRSQVKEAQTKLQEDLSPVSGQPLS